MQVYKLLYIVKVCCKRVYFLQIYRKKSAYIKIKTLSESLNTSAVMVNAYERYN